MVLKFLYISLLILINVSAHFATNLYPENEAAGILADPQQINDRIIGSKIVIALEQCMLFSTWGVKFCVWGFERRCWYVVIYLPSYNAFLTTHSRQLPVYERALNVLLAYIVVGLVATEICYLAVWCRPIHQYWAVPVQNSQCATYAHYSIMQATFNMTSDFMIMAIPIHMVFKNKHMKFSRRCVLAFVFSLAIFTIIAAVLNK